MATTAGTTLPMAALAPPMGEVIPTYEFRADAAIAKGDIVIADAVPSGRITVAASGSVAINTIIGVVQQIVAAAADDTVVALALPGVKFTGNLCNNAADFPGVLATDVLVSHGVIENGQEGYWCLDQNASGIAYALGYARQKGTSTDPTQKSRPQTAGVGVTNPRMVFVFTSSVFYTDTTA